ncbi:hypothetical protein [Metabacillus litoralis]|uniref:Uncharacterized protein n=1 Tax=Metabacillus litoralis TaxID=152268 RepID=A0A179SXT0_9BACI|nr:hypothetical protein [Metabacillus litoralis]OAS85093.1 hypothetical protein A6K24_06170 [Metabacillus litoralis]
MRKKADLIVPYFEDNLKRIEGELAKEIFVHTQKVVEEANSRGVLQSGMTISGMLKVLEDKVNTQLHDSLSLIEEFQNKMNIKINDDDLDLISATYSKFFTTFYYNQYNQIGEKAKNYVGGNLSENITNSVVLNSLINNINRLIDYQIKEIKIKNAVKQDEPSIIIAKKSLRNSRIAIIISFIVGCATIYNIFFK